MIEKLEKAYNKSGEDAAYKMMSLWEAAGYGESYIDNAWDYVKANNKYWYMPTYDTSSEVRSYKK